MEKILLILLSITFLLNGCQRGKPEVEEINFEEPTYGEAVFDSLMWLQYHCPEDEEKTIYEWNWAYDVREVLDVEDLDSLTTLSRNADDSYHFLADSGIPFQMNTATNMYAGTARFCMLNVYQSLAELVYETPLGENDSYYHDYALWEDLFNEFDAKYDNSGSSRGYEVDFYYTQLAESRTDHLLEELAFISETDADQKKYTNAKPPKMDKQWIKTHPSIQHWYDHRMKMAQKIHLTNPAWAQCIRALTYKQVALYIKFEIISEKEYDIGVEDI